MLQANLKIRFSHLDNTVEQKVTGATIEEMLEQATKRLTNSIGIRYTADSVSAISDDEYFGRFTSGLVGAQPILFDLMITKD